MQTNEKLVTNLDHKGTELPLSKRSYYKIKLKNTISINEFGHENKHVYPAYLLKEKLENNMKFLLKFFRDAQVKDFHRFMYNKAKRKEKNALAML